MSNVITLEKGTALLSQDFNSSTLTPSEASRVTIHIISLLSDSQCDVPFLKLISRFLTKQSYEELVTERNVSVLCGYPLCGKQTGKIRDVYSNERKLSQSLMPNSYLLSYCSKVHDRCSQLYYQQLSEEAVFARENIGTAPFGTMSKYEGGIVLLEEVLQSSSAVSDLTERIEALNIDKKSSNNNNNKDITMDDLAEMTEDIKIIENDIQEPPTEPFNDLDGLNDTEKYEYLQDQSKAIDGYVLK